MVSMGYGGGEGGGLWQAMPPPLGWAVCAGPGWAEGLSVPSQVEFSPKVLQQNPPNGWFRLLPFPRAEEESG